MNSVLKMQNLTIPCRYIYHSPAPALKDYQSNLLQNPTYAKNREKSKNQAIDIY